MVHIGGDLHKRISRLAVLTADGEITQHRVDNDRGQMERLY